MKIKNELINEMLKTEAPRKSVEDLILDVDLERELKDSRVTYDPDFKGLEPILSLNEEGTQVPMLHRGGISTALAHVKSGKTFLMWLLAFFAAKVRDSAKIISHLFVGDRVGIFDTEQGDARCQGKFNNYFPEEYDIAVDVFSLRHVSTKTILKLVELYIHKYRPKLVFIDIGSDLVPGGVNDLHNSDETVNTLSRLAEKYNMHIVVSLHLSRSKGEAMGHFGSVLLKRSESVFTVRKIKDYFVVKPLYTRDEPWQPWTFQIQDNIGVPVEIELDNDGVEQSDSKKKSDFASVPAKTHHEVIQKVFGETNKLKPKIFKENLKVIYGEMVSEIGLLLVKELQRYYVEHGYLVKDSGFLFPAQVSGVTHM